VSARPKPSSRINTNWIPTRMATNAASYNPRQYTNWFFLRQRLRTLAFLGYLWYSLLTIVPVGVETGPVSGQPPAVSSEIKDAINDSAKAEATGSHVSGQDAGSKVGTAEAATGEKKVKSEKECMHQS